MPAQYIHISNEENVILIKCKLEAYIGLEKPGMYISYCPALDLYSQGDTRAEAKKNIKEATGLFLQSCIERQTLQRVLTECGFKSTAPFAAHKALAKAVALPPEFETSKPFKIPVELPMMAYG